MFSPGHMHKWQNPFPSNHLANVISLQLHKESKWIPLLACWNQRNCHGYPVVDIFLRFPFDDERGSQLLTFGLLDLLDFYFLCLRWWCHQYCPKMNMMATMLSGPGSILSHYWWSSRLHTVNPPTSALSMMITFWNYDDFADEGGSGTVTKKNHSHLPVVEHNQRDQLGCNSSSPSENTKLHKWCYSTVSIYFMIAGLFPFSFWGPMLLYIISDKRLMVTQRSPGRTEILLKCFWKALWWWLPLVRSL